MGSVTGSSLRKVEGNVYYPDKFSATSTTSGNIEPSFGDFGIKEYTADSIGTKATPEGLYGTGDLDRAGQLSKIVDFLNKSIGNVKYAIENYDDEIERDGQIDILRHNIFELLVLRRVNRNFGDVLTAIQVALKNKKYATFKRDELVKMKSVLETMKNNFNMTESVFEKCIDVLDENFDISIPIQDDVVDA